MSNSGALTSRLEELESCGFIRKYYTFGAKKKYAVYQLMDCFTLFYYQFLDKQPSDEAFLTNQVNTPKINTWIGLVFEKVCMMHIPQIKKKLGISGVYTEVNSWYCKEDPEKNIHGSQIDLLIIRKDQVINLCKMKHADTEYILTKKEDIALRNRIHDLITATGTKYAVIQAVITMEDLF